MLVGQPVPVFSQPLAEQPVRVLPPAFRVVQPVRAADELRLARARVMASRAWVQVSARVLRVFLQQPARVAEQRVVVLAQLAFPVRARVLEQPEWAPVAVMSAAEKAGGAHCGNIVANHRHPDVLVRA
ncbi:MAG: hypothetical protein ACO1O2_24580 [Larkinella arboricola]